MTSSPRRTPLLLLHSPRIGPSGANLSPRRGPNRLAASMLTCLALLEAACASSRPTQVGYDTTPSPEPPVAAAPESQAVVPSDVVLRARGPVRVLRSTDQADVPTERVAEELLSADAVCAGEEHSRPRHHYAELWLLERLSERAPNLGLELGVGFEMWASDFQRELGDYQRGRIDESTLLRRTEYEQRWGYPFAYYSPILERARKLRLPLVALNARGELTRKISESGVDGLSRRQARSLPDLDLDDAVHRADFERRMQRHPGVTPDTLDRFYQAQVVWDETMAATAAKWLSAHAPMRRMLILAGQAHCQETAIPKRLERRGARRVLSVLLAEKMPSAELRQSYDYVVLVGDTASQSED